MCSRLGCVEMRRIYYRFPVEMRRIYRFPVLAAEAPAHARYPYVRGSYRSGGSYADNLRSIFQLHTETVNCWTMLVACVVSMACAAWGCAYVVDAEGAPIFILFSATTLVHAPFSVGYHLFTSMHREVFDVWRKLDVTAILVVTVMLTYALAYFVIPFWACMVITSVAGAVASTAIAIFWRTPNMQPVALAMFTGGASLCYLFPMVCATVRDGLMSVSSAATAGVLASLAFSGWVYVSAWPQRCFPGAFDVWGHSHQLMHVGVIVCHALEFLFLYDNWRRLQKLPEKHLGYT